GLAGRVRVGLERGPPHLQGVHPGGFVVQGAEHHHGAVVEDRVPVAGDRGGDLFADRVVGQQQAAALGAGVEDVEDVFAVGGADQGEELQAGHVGVERFDGSGGQVVAA